VGAFYARDDLTVTRAIESWTASFLAADAIALVMVGVRNIDLPAVLRPHWDVLRAQIKYGAQGQMANLAQLFNYRLDQFLVAAFVSTAGVGHYAVAVGLSESVWWISSAIALVLLPRLTEMDRERANEVTPLICRNTFLVSIVASAALAAAAPIAIPIIFGSEYDSATLALVLLLPGIIAASATRVLGTYLFSQGRIIYNTYATFIALGLTIALDLALIPLLEINGAAIASSVAYVASMIATLYWYRRVSGGRIRDALLPRPSDVSFYAEVLDRVRRKPRPSADAP
jgi:O-antigen/teichoic acid export membrane protein